jgi:hypothetical protein
MFAVFPNVLDYRRSISRGTSQLRASAEITTAWLHCGCVGYVEQRTFAIAVNNPKLLMLTSGYHNLD